jgi:hypothetical protein
MSEEYLLVYFEKENKYSVVCNTGRFKKGGRATVKDALTQKWGTGDILYVGPEHKCIEKGDQIGKATYFETTDDDTSSASPPKQKNKSVKQKLAAAFENYNNHKSQKKSQKRLRVCDNDDEIEMLDSRPLKTSTPSTKSTIQIQKCKPKNNLCDIEEESEYDTVFPKVVEDTQTFKYNNFHSDTLTRSQTSPSKNSPDKTYQNDDLKSLVLENNKLLNEQNQMLQKLLKRKNMLSQKELMFNGKNLLDINYKHDMPAQFINEVMDILFTPDELRKGYIPSTKNTGKKSARDELEQQRVEILKQAVHIKFKAQEDEKAKVWEDARIKANRHCYDESKSTKANRSVQRDDED